MPRRSFYPIVFAHALLILAGLLTPLLSAAATDNLEPSEKHFLYVATPGIRNYLEYGGHGILVFDIDHQHCFVKRIPSAGFDTNGQPLNVKGICGNAQTRRL